jgi:hypothetical protein
LTKEMTCCVGVRLEHIGAERALPHAGDELADDLEVDVRLEQGDAHLAEGLVEVLLADGAVRAQLAEDALEAFGQRVEHTATFYKNGGWKRVRKPSPPAILAIPNG